MKGEREIMKTPENYDLYCEAVHKESGEKEKTIISISPREPGEAMKNRLCIIHQALANLTSRKTDAA